MIGVFDSGIGGLTVLSALRDAMPMCDILYLGDTARVPYGTRSPQTVVKYSLRVASWLHQQGVSAIVIACNTASTHALPTLQRAGRAAGIPVFGVVEPGVRAALAVHTTGAIAVLGTEGTISGGAYQRSLNRLAPSVPVSARACPLLVPLVEEGWLTGDVPSLVAERYIGDLKGTVDTAILGCTHYPMLRPILSQLLPGVALVDSATATATEVRASVHDVGGNATTIYAATDHVERFKRVGATFLTTPPTDVEWVDLGPARGPFALGLTTELNRLQ